MAETKTGALIVGSGIIGLTIARELLRKGIEHIIIIDKEDGPDRHASGRNSGVLHAGIYYEAESMKAQSCLSGNRLMKEYCQRNNLPLRESGKVVVARNRKELSVLRTLHSRAIRNGARVELIDTGRLREIEPNAKTTEIALLSHDTAVVDPKAILHQLKTDLEATGRVRFKYQHTFLDIAGSDTAVTTGGKIRFERFVNAAGAHCDSVARKFGVGREYHLVPFKGVYRKIKPSSSNFVLGNIYPVPDIRNPFLGIHFTRSVYGDIYVGPTAIPVFGRENYKLWNGVQAEGARILLDDALLFLLNPKFRLIALKEPRKYIRSLFFNDASRLVRTLSSNDLEASPKAGIRAQLVDWKKKELVMDFKVEFDGPCMHVLNPISPAFTCSMDLARRVVNDFI